MWWGMILTASERERVLDVTRRVLEEIGPECSGVFFDVADVPVDGNGLTRPAVLLKWDPKVHPKTRHDPIQAIVLENVMTGAQIKDETLRRVVREKVEHLLKVDQHAHKELVDVSRISPAEGRHELEKSLESLTQRN